MQRLAIALLLVGCRWHFDEREPDASPPDAAPLALACNTAVKLTDAPPGGKLTVTATTTTIVAGWLEPSGQLVAGRARLVAPDQVYGDAAEITGGTGYTVVSAAAAGDTIVGAFTTNSASWVSVTDAQFKPIQGPTPLALPPGGPRAVASTGNTSGSIAAVTTISASAAQTTLYGIHSDATLSPPLAVPVAAPIAQSALVNVGDRLAIAYSTSLSNCYVRTVDLAITSAGATAGWGTTNQCTQSHLGYSAGRSDALLIRHDMTDDDLNHVVATRSGVTYTIPGENRLRNPANEPRAVGVTDGYWVSYETGGTLEAAHVDFAGTVGTPVVLGPLSDTTAHGTVLLAGTAYVVWVQDGLELARLCN